MHFRPRPAGLYTESNTVSRLLWRVLQAEVTYPQFPCRTRGVLLLPQRRAGAGRHDVAPVWYNPMLPAVVLSVRADHPAEISPLPPDQRVYCYTLDGSRSSRRADGDEDLVRRGCGISGGQRAARRVGDHMPRTGHDQHQEATDRPAPSVDVEGLGLSKAPVSPRSQGQVDFRTVPTDRCHRPRASSPCESSRT